MQLGELFYRLKQCKQFQAPLEGRKIHSHMQKTGIVSFLPNFCNVLMDLYGRCGYVEDALKLFEEMPKRDLVSWSSTLTTLNKANLSDRSISLFSSMFFLDRLQPDHFIFASLVKACALVTDVRLGRQVHAQFLKSTFSDDNVIKSSLVDMYAKHGLPEKACLVFDTIGSRNTACWTALISGYARSGKKSEAIEMFEKLDEKTLVSWTALISGLVQAGNHVDAFQLFAEMRREGVEITDPFVLSTISGAAACLASLGLGEQVHSLILTLGYDSDLFLTNALVDMYAKCSDLSAAKKIFDDMSKRDTASWTSIIVGMAKHGRGSKALSLYDEMILAGVKPNEVTFTGLIYACSHVGLVEKGRGLFESMVKDYCIKPSLQHYTCLLDLYSRSGHLDEAEDLLKTMPFQPDEAVWVALLSACIHHKNSKMGVRIADHILRLGPKDPATCILLSHAYACAGIWNNASKVRKLMVEMGISREPGYSCIDLGKDSLVFHAGESLDHTKD